MAGNCHQRISFSKENLGFFFEDYRFGSLTRLILNCLIYGSAKKLKESMELLVWVESIGGTL